MALKEELLKPIWHAFTALDVDKSGKVSKSQLKVQGAFNKVEFNRMCWTLCAKKYLSKSTLLISEDNAFKVWTIFNYLSEDKYPLVIVPEEGYLWKKGHKRKNWTERWFVLKTNVITYYVGEELKDKKGEIMLDENCCVESLPDRDGKKCLLLVKCLDKSYEISASDKKKKQEWIQAIQTVVNLRRLGLPPPHKEARQKRKALRQKLLTEQEELEKQMKDLLAINEKKQRELEDMQKQLQHAAAQATEEEQKRHETHVELQDRYRGELEREKMIRQQMEEQVAQKSSELEQYLNRVRELEALYNQLQEALDDEKQARQDEETVRHLQARLLEEEAGKRTELEKLHKEQERTIRMTEAEKKELETIREIKEKALQEAMQQLEQLETERLEALQQYEKVTKNLEVAANKTRNWKDKVAHHEGLIRLIQPGSKTPGLINNWGPASFTEGEFEQKKMIWQEKRNPTTE
ncbi:hypothetical protein FKM82_003223 [Ascaphus truei]